jgi:hypothetical protein
MYGLQRYNPRYTKLDGFLRHPCEPLAVAGRYSQRERRLRRAVFGRLDLHQPLGTGAYQTAGAYEPSTVQYLDPLVLAGAPDPEMMHLALLEGGPLSNHGAAPWNENSH